MCLKEEGNSDRTHLQIKENIKPLKKTYMGIIKRIMVHQKGGEGHLSFSAN